MRGLEAPDLPEAPERFIPVPAADLIARLTATPLPDADAASFSEFCTILQAVIHYRFLARAEELKQLYLPLGPRGDLVVSEELDAGARRLRETQLIASMGELLEQGNYERIGDEVLPKVFAMDSPFDVQVDVDLDRYDVVHLYYRGRSQDFKHRRALRKSKAKKVPYPTFSRVVLIVRKKNEPELLLKLFSDVPQSGVEILMPETKLRMTKSSRFEMLAVLGVAILGIGSVIHSLVTDGGKSIWAVLGAAVVWGGKVGLGFKRARDKYTASLISKLYFANLTNNMGVIQQLVDMGQEEEVKEALLAFYFLRKAGGSCTIDDLTNDVESYLDSEFGVRCEFEVADGVGKLVADGLASQEGSMVTAVTITEANAKLDAYWDDLFHSG